MNCFRLSAIGLALILIITLIACGKATSAQPTPTQTLSNLEITPTNTPTDSEATLLDDRLQDSDTSLNPKILSNPQGTNSSISMKFDTNGPWINSNPFTSEKKQAEVILVDFWTYSCVNCIRTLPYLKEWHTKYNDKGLTIIGVHSPEFEFEKIYENVSTSVKEFGIEYPVVLDSDLKIWKSFNNRYWPAKYLLDKTGTIRYMHFGEGEYRETESAIRSLLTETGADLSRLPIDSVIPSSAGPSENRGSEQTIELYLGTDRNYAFKFFQPPYIGNKEYYENVRSNDWEKETNFKNPSLREENKIYINGLWLKEKENIFHSRNTDDYIDFISLIFSGTEVNVVLGEHKEPYKVMITLEDNLLLKSEAGTDVHFDQLGNSFVLVNESRMYNLIKLKAFETRDLKLTSKSAGFSVYSFTFGSEPRKP